MKLAIMIIAPALTILSYLAQTGKVIKTRDASGLSAPMFALSTFSFAMWVVYGVVAGELPLIIPNAVCCALAALILVLKLKKT